jgi:hypothetical protein
MKTIKKMTTKELKKEYKELEFIIDVMGCYGSEDIKRIISIQNELNSRN